MMDALRKAEMRATEHGRDPRYAPPWIAENTGLLQELTAKSTREPKAATASSSAAVHSIMCLEHLEWALEHAATTGRLVVVKYYAPWCKACLNIKPFYERMAEGPLGQYADFYEVDAGCARVLVALANIEAMPVVHVYARGTLAQTYAIEKKELFDRFSMGLGHLAMQGGATA